MTTEIIVQLITLVSVIAGYLYNLYREKRNREWDIEDRERVAAELANKVVETEQNLATYTKIQQDKLMSKIEQNTAITKQIHQKTYETEANLKLMAEKYDAVGKRPQDESK